MKEILITLCARAGSKGIPGKNIKELAGRPLIAYSIKHSKDFVSKHGGDIIVSTDSTDILDIAKTYGLPTDYVRPERLATDTIGKIDVIDDALKYMEETSATKYKFILDLDITSPLRTIEDLSKSYESLQNNLEAINIFSVNLANRNPYFNMVEQDENGFVSLVKKGTFKTRQSAPKVYDLNASFYFYKREFFEKRYESVITNRSLVYLMPHTCFDLDEPMDFLLMNYLISNNLLDFEL